MFGNPVDPTGRIQAKTEVWLGTPTFRVTDTFQEHVLNNRAPGVDFGNLRCGDTVYSAAAGRISQVLTDPNGAIIVRIDHGVIDGKRTITGYAHLQKIETKVGVQVARGVAIGHVGKTGASACHLHWGVNINGVEVDGWPLLDQNGAEMIEGTNPVRLINRTTTLKGNATNFRPSPNTVEPQLAQFQAGTGFIPDFVVDGQKVGTSTKWVTGMLPVKGVLTRGYFHESVINPLSPSESSGYTEAEMAAAKAAAKLEGATENEAKWTAWTATHP